MYVVELEYPGSQIAYEDEELAFEIEGIFITIESQLSQAMMALDLFLQVHVPPIHDPELAAIQLTIDNAQRLKLTGQYLNQAYGTSLLNSSYTQHEEARYQAAHAYDQAKWMSGGIPRSCSRARSFIYAKSFLYSIHMIGQLLKVLNRQGAPAEVVAQTHAFAARFPDLVGVRDSVQHLDERIRGRAVVKGKVVDLRQGGGLEIENLHNNTFRTIMANGQVGVVEVSVDNLNWVAECLQKVIDAYQWTGFKEYFPR